MRSAVTHAELYLQPSGVHYSLRIFTDFHGPKKELRSHLLILSNGAFAWCVCVCDLTNFDLKRRTNIKGGITTPLSGV